MRNIDFSAREILHTASTVLAANPRATLEEIARAAGLSRATLHRAFSSREALLRATALDALASVEDGLRTVPLERGDALAVLRKVIEVLVPLGAKFHFLASEDWLEREEEVATRLAQLQGALGGVLERARGEGLLDGSSPWNGSVAPSSRSSMRDGRRSADRTSCRAMRCGRPSRPS